MKYFFELFVLFLLLFTLFACSEKLKHDENRPHEQFSSYWYQGKAELNNYRLEQARYGEIRSGESVLIFVTEDFSKSKHVKLDQPDKAGNDAQSVLKLNMSKKFDTGLYPYSMFLSCFTPIGENSVMRPLKSNASIQEWCGHVFAQMNLKGNQYHFKEFSYFESTGDKETKMPADYSEDAIFNQIRINPDYLPIGDFQMIPGLFFSRLKHKPLQSVKAIAVKKIQNDSISDYTIDFPDLSRTLSISYTTDSPYFITGWTEVYPEGDTLMQTKATFKNRIFLDYWNFNTVADSTIRKAFLLD